MSQNYPTQLRLNVMKPLADGEHRDEVAKHLQLPLETVIEISQTHGYPHPGSMQRAVEALAHKVRGELPTPEKDDDDDFLGRVDEVLISARQWSQSIIQARAARLIQSLRKLDDDLRADAAAEAARRHEREKREKLDAEAARLREQLAKIESQLPKTVRRKGTGRPNPASAGIIRRQLDAQNEWLAELGVTAQQIREWGASKGMEVRGSIIANKVRAAYEAEHLNVSV